MFAHLKKFLRKIIPVSRSYLDRKIDSSAKKLSQLEENNIQSAQKQTEKNLTGKLNHIAEQNRDLMASVSKQDDILQTHCDMLQKQMDNKFEQQHKMLEQQKKMLEQQKKMLDADWDYLRVIRWEEFKKLQEHLDQELARRDDWGPRAEQFRMEAGERPWWIIKCPSPEDDSKVKWGDYHFARSLSRYLERLGIYVTLDTREDWACEAQADVVVVLRGCRFYRPDRRSKKTIYVMWNISHPAEITTAEYELYDAVCVSSSWYAKELKKQIKVPVYELLQCTDTELFYPEKYNPEHIVNDFIFIGNSRGVARNCVLWAIEDNLPFKMWGGGWDRILKDHMDIIVAPSIENESIPDLYRSSKVTLNDHWPDMLEKQFINNRIFDALACGLPVISDKCDDLVRIFPDSVLYYSNKEEFDYCVKQLETDYDNIRKRVETQWPLIKNQFSFEARAKQLIAIAESLL